MGGSCTDVVTSCGDFTCDGSMMSCLTSCGTDAQCTSGRYCAAGGACTAKKAAGLTCMGANECSSGYCVDGVCCNGACNGTCESCNLSGTAGTCSPKPLARVGSEVTLSSGSSDEHFSMVWGGSQFGVAWIGADQTARMRRVGADGSLLSPAIQTSAVGAQALLGGGASIAWNGTSFGVLWTEPATGLSSKLMLRGVDATGSLAVGPVPMNNYAATRAIDASGNALALAAQIAPVGSSPTVAWSGSLLGVLWRDQGGRFVRAWCD